MRRWAWLILALTATVASARLTTFEWQNDPSWPASTTIELCSNGVCAGGIVGMQHTLDVPIEPGQRFDSAARAVTPDGLLSDWATLTQTWPSLPIGLWARSERDEIDMSDTYWTSVVLLLDFEGAEVADRSVSAKGAGTLNGNCALSTAQYKFGSQSLIGDGTGDWLQYADNDDWSFGSGDFTIELFYRPNNTNAVQGVIGQWASGGSGRSWIIYRTATNNLQFSFSAQGSGGTQTNAFNVSSGMSANTWYHLAITRSGANIRGFINGSQIGSTYDAGTTQFQASTEVLRIGAAQSDGYGSLNGHIDEVRLTKGVARYTANFTAPSEAFSQTGGVAALPRRALDGPFYGALRGSVR